VEPPHSSHDRFTQDEDGWFYFVDRDQDTIGVLRLYPGVLETAVLSLPSTDAEEEIMAVFQVDNTWDGDYEALLRYCYQELAYFAAPRYFRAVSEFPRTSSQKIRKDILREDGSPATPGTGGLADARRWMNAGPPCAALNRFIR
jgi:crotonobetaine/carnitine-CoA ligase